MNRRDFNFQLVAALSALAVRGEAVSFPQPQPRVNGKRLNEQLRSLSRFGKNAEGGVSRMGYTDADRDARLYVMQLMRTAKLEVSVDAAGNILGRRAGREATLPTLMMGSHIDSVPQGGNYDGDVGSLGAIEVAQTLAERNFELRHPLEVMIFQYEEGGLTGSRAIIGELTKENLEVVSTSGKTIRDGIKFIGGDPDRIQSVRRKRGDIAAYLELHIEQGGVLDREKIDIGVVEGIVGIRDWEVTIQGFANHAGTTPMDQRKDALVVAAKFILAVNRIVTEKPGKQVGTVGRIEASPGAPNVVPGRVRLSLELRDLDATKIESLFQTIRAEARRIGKEHGTEFTFQEYNINNPAPTDSEVRRMISEAATELGLSSKEMPSGAGHDAQSIARLAPIGMIFVPSVRGISHSPKELSRPKDIESGANVLLRTLLKLDAVGG
ncbi:MAG: Zn-dependent hydrolase [Anaerolineae bacterium]|nr:Zn-dependent hydrolase [Gemmatimonadaceae bacterium]